jgi:Glycosyl hydrolase family 14
MAVSQPIFMGYVVTNGSDFLSLYFTSKKVEGSGTAVDQFYWIKSNSSGVLTDRRANNANGYFTSQSEALSNIPSGYSDVPADDLYESTTEVGYMSNFPERDIAKAKSEYDDAIANGVTYIMLSVIWNGNSSSPNGGVFNTYTPPASVTDYSQTTNHDRCWAFYDELIDYATSKTATNGNKVKVAIRLVLTLDDGSHNDIEGTNTSGFIGLSEMAKDHLGFVSRVAEGIGQISFANTTATAQALDFVQKAATRYAARVASNGSSILQMSCGTAAQWECGYGYENQQYPAARYQTSYDYSSYSKSGFRTYITGLYSTIGTANTHWGTSFASFSVVEPPTNGDNSTYSTALGYDWWQWNYSLVKGFQEDCKAVINTYATTAKYVLEWGSCTDTLAPRRMAINVNDMPTYSDMMKAQFGKSLRSPDLSITLDVLRTNYSKKLGTELNMYDFFSDMYGATTAAEMKSMMIYMGKACIESGAKDILFIGDKYNVANFVSLLECIVELKAYMATQNGRISGDITVNYSLGNILLSYDSWLSSWRSAGGSNNKRINMFQTDNIDIPPSESCNFPLQIYDTHTFCLNSADLKSNDYYNAGEFSTLQNNYNTNRFRLWAMTHSISYIAGQPAKSNWYIKGATDNIIYVRNTQSIAYYSTQDNTDPRQNNHPERSPANPILNDALMYIPIGGQNFTVYMENTGSYPITMEVYGLDPYQPLLQKKLVSGASHSYTINMSTITKTSIKIIKVNGNRTTDTDTLSDYSN